MHVTFNTLGVLLWIGFIDKLALAVEQLADDVPRQIANAHTIFNVANTAIFIWFTTPLARFVTWLVPERPEVPSETAQPKYLDPILLKTPSLAIDSVRRELGRLGVAALHMVRGGLTTTLKGDAEALKHLEDLDDDIDSLHGAIVTYLGQVSQLSLTDSQTRRVYDYLAAANYFENIGDLIETQLVQTGRQRLNSGLTVSSETEEVLTAIHHEVCWAVEHAIRALVDQDVEVALDVSEAKAEVNRLVSVAEEHLSKRLTATAPNRLVAYRLESEIMEHLKRMYYFAKRVARLAAQNGDRELVASSEQQPASGELSENSPAEDDSPGNAEPA